MKTSEALLLIVTVAGLALFCAQGFYRDADSGHLELEAWKSGDRFQFSVEKAYTVRYFTPMFLQ